MECAGNNLGLQVRVPTWRFDVNDPVVLIEDVARMVGYDQIPVSPQPARPSLGLRVITDRLRQAVSEHLVSAGFYECRNPSLESPQSSPWLGTAGYAITLGNAATREMSVLRRTLLASLAATVQTNVRRGAQSVWFFEVDRVFGSSAAEPDPTDKSLRGRWHVSGIAGGRLLRSNWRSDTTQVDFFALKGAVEDLLESIGACGVAFRPTDQAPFVAGTAAEISLGASKSIGLIGEIEQKVVEFDRVPFRVYAFELDLESLEDGFAALPAYRQLVRLPAVTRDLAIVVRIGEAYADIVETIRSVAGTTLESLRLVDQYQGAQVSSGHQSLAFHLVFRDAERTLTAEEVAETMAKIVSALADRFGAELRR
jgi:phenylalanyl-tRNA synthetase beta chain